MIRKITAFTFFMAIFLASNAYADKLDDIIASGTLKCAAVLDFPPMGFRNNNNEPDGYDVDMCRDLAKVLGVKLEVVETPFPDRIPALISGRADVGIASTSDTLERAKTIGFSIPYFAFEFNVLTRKDTGIKTYEDMCGKKVGNVAGTYEAIRLEPFIKGCGGSFSAYQSEADLLLALKQKQIEATVVTSTVAWAHVKSGKYPTLTVAGKAPYATDYVSLIAVRSEYGMINYLNLFVNQQIRTGRAQELFNKWIGEGPMPAYTIPGAYY
jgi:polar amino acid transport system substrate-binding protein